MNPHTLRGLIFDLDGVLVDTVHLHYRAWKKVLKHLGIPFERSDMDRFRGVRQREILLTLTAGLSEAEIATCLARKDTYYRQLLAEASKSIVHQPAVAVLHAARAHDLKVGLASSSINANHVLNAVHLLGLFDAIGDGNSVARSKPAPDIFVWVAGALGLNPAQVAVIEDGSAGVQGACAAGMFVVGVNITDRTCYPNLNLTMEALQFETIVSHFENSQVAVC